MENRRERLREPALAPPLDSMIPDDHPIRRLNQIVDTHFVHEAVRDRYGIGDKPLSIDPEEFIRLFLIQAVYGIPDVRKLMHDVAVYVTYRWFIGFGWKPQLPDFAELAEALDQFGDDVFNELFTRCIAQCEAGGVLTCDSLHLDAASIRADLDRHRVRASDGIPPTSNT